jgi:type II pantothenate kinase
LKKVLGIDMGCSTTKIVGFDGDNLIGAMQEEAGDKETALYGVIEKFLHLHQIKLRDIDEIFLTGVGASFVEKDLFDIKTHRVSEFRAIGRGGLRVSGLSEGIIVSVGTGTAVVRASSEGDRHMGGSGVGGGTLLGLSSLLIDENDLCKISSLAEKGDLGNVDLLISHVVKEASASLPMNATASNFGNVSRSASREDLALGIVSLVVQTVGMIAVFACANDTIKDVVLTGSATKLPQWAQIMSEIHKMTGVRFHIPENAVYATAIGATECRQEAIIENN